MGKVGFLYPGQGSQKVGMMKELLQDAPELFERYIARSQQVAGVPIIKYGLEGPLELLSQTHVVQPTLFAYSLALTEYLRQQGIAPDMVAGHSLGEYTAAVASGSLSFEEGLYLVSLRGRLMERVQQTQPGAMAAVIGLPKEELDAICSTISKNDLVLVTNWNAPAQLVVSGVEAGVEQLVETVRKQENVKALRLPVKGAFHSPLMEPVQYALREITQDISWYDTHIPLVANVSGVPLTRGPHIRQELIEQITKPVRWVSCIETLIQAGCDTLIELGPGQVLTKLARLIAPGIKAFAIDAPAKLGVVAQV
ncbi:MAG TPA: ACP S-malonyltransferase [Ktedonobacteraceae bacterium]|nr:ACP S-malonyltransferase [Ktedonobacteraceae bacterium]